MKVRKTAKIRNQYNQVPHLTQDTTLEREKSQLGITYKSQEVSPFPAGDHKAAKHDKHKTQITQMIHKRIPLMTEPTKLLNVLIVRTITSDVSISFWFNPISVTAALHVFHKQESNLFSRKLVINQMGVKL